jgi:general stress protein 26
MLTRTREQENGGIDLLFHANTESGKMTDLESDPHVNISFLNNTGEWASVSGTVTVVADRVFVRKYYSPSLKAWFGDLGDGVHDGGPEDPRIAMIRVTTTTATYMVVRKGMVARGMDVEKGMVTGEVAGINRLREIGREEVEGWRERWRSAQ